MCTSCQDCSIKGVVVAGMRIDVLTLFPEMFQCMLDSSLIGRARGAGVLKINLINFREYSVDRHRVVDDYPFGGGAGMVLKPEPIFAAVDRLRSGGADGAPEAPVILMSPQGRLLSHDVAQELSECAHLIIVCGHYEGFDERIRTHLAADEVSIGDYVLTGGELAAMVLLDAVARFVPGVLGNSDSHRLDSFADGLLEHPQYTRPRVFRGAGVPEVLLSGDHAKIAAWRRRQALLRTLRRRPDLLLRAPLSDSDRRTVEMLRVEDEGQDES